MFADGPLGFVDQLIDAFDWKKLAVPAGAIVGFSILIRIATKLYFWFGRKQAETMEQELRVGRLALTAAHRNIESLKIQQASQEATIGAQRELSKKQDVSLVERKSEFDKLMSSAQRLKKEYLLLVEVKKQHDQLKQDHGALQVTVKSLEDSIIGGDEALRKVRDELLAREEQIARAERRMHKAQKLGGYLIKAKALLARPKFKLLEERRRPILSVAALKGGVGKTTLTAHLAGALARRGYRVLVVDLDLQGSLTGLMLPVGTINQQVKDKRLMQDYFLKAALDKSTTLTDYIVAVPQPKGVTGTIGIAPTSDRLAYAELNLTLGWLLKQGERDARFLLRRALHLKGPNAGYDIVLLDCPPVLNISCANALAASDYLLIPTLLTTKSLERVPVMVKAVQDDQFLQQLNPHLRLMGVVANRTRTSKLEGREAILWQRLPNRLTPIQKSHTKLFVSLIAQDAEVSSNEEQYTHPKSGGRAHKMFTQLLAELEQELPDACRIPQPQPT